MYNFDLKNSFFDTCSLRTLSSLLSTHLQPTLLLTGEQIQHSHNQCFRRLHVKGEPQCKVEHRVLTWRFSKFIDIAPTGSASQICLVNAEESYIACVSFT